MIISGARWSKDSLYSWDVYALAREMVYEVPEGYVVDWEATQHHLGQLVRHAFVGFALYDG